MVMKFFVILLCLSVYTYLHSYMRLVISVSLSDDLKQLNDKLVEVNTSKMSLQMKLDELETAEINIKVSKTHITSESYI